MNVFTDTLAWLADPLHWSGSGGIPARLGEHLQYSALVLLIAAAIAIPLGLYIGHTGRGRVAAVAVAGALRALPTLGLLVLFALLAGTGLMPPVWALVILTVPPLLAGTYAGISSVDPAIVDAARAMGMTERQILGSVEIPNGLQVMFGGLRTAVLQVIGTVSVFAYLPLGGLGRYLFDGLLMQDFPRMLAGSLLIAALAIVVDLLLALIQRLVMSPGLSTTSHTSRSQSNAADTDPKAAAPAAASVPGGTQ
ncbi:ABC transporter permease [Pseudarthrobacter sp. J75]|uniref:ABC transporter permease n=1 Tax=unclassified Pseudarthrobacter TaxID=2647000 RepID=UPI002E7FF45D|nr:MULTISPECIES: ABC transporter permease [unclassified Pseudarthrobacter]MEE2521260.1 ABC transporter permease [Pseudarthrobacter sp. J47]MEE2528492.1 ABC transporter permease [Pseudarthrobacter sp. J75]